MIGSVRRAALGLRARRLAFIFSLVLVCARAAPAQDVELLVNGDFNQAATGWQVANTGTGSWFLASVGVATPLTGLPTSADGPGDGVYALTDASGPGTRALLQNFTLAATTLRVVFAFDLFVNDWAGTTTFDSLQHARVDLLTLAAPSFDTGAGVLFNAYLGTDGGPLPNEFAHYEFDITPYVAAGGTFKVRFYETDSSNVMNIGVDNVRVAIVPEPTATSLAALATCILFVTSRHRRRTMATRSV